MKKLKATITFEYVANPNNYFGPTDKEIDTKEMIKIDIENTMDTPD